MPPLESITYSAPRSPARPSRASQLAQVALDQRLDVDVGDRAWRCARTRGSRARPPRRARRAGAEPHAAGGARTRSCSGLAKLWRNDDRDRLDPCRRSSSRASRSTYCSSSRRSAPPRPGCAAARRSAGGAERAAAAARPSGRRGRSDARGRSRARRGTPASRAAPCGAPALDDGVGDQRGAVHDGPSAQSEPGRPSVSASTVSTPCDGRPAWSASCRPRALVASSKIGRSVNVPPMSTPAR